MLLELIKRKKGDMTNYRLWLECREIDPTISQSTIHRIINGESYPHRNIDTILKALDVELL